MTKLRITLTGIALSGTLLAAGSAPALADSLSADIKSKATASAVTKAQKLAKLKSITLDTSASTVNWGSALTLHIQKDRAITQYNFNWNTDYCSNSPNELPGGYSFKLACHRHDFGYRNYKELVGEPTFKREHKLRVDKALLLDLKSACNYKPWGDAYPPAQRQQLKNNCLKIAQKYYDAVRVFG
ncbi:MULTISPECIES: phospholipase A2 [unclassified Streptomyces]|uniref:phospholipase A2 n=1 Tax=unclassified Streptomyces TaxID=2593676 RepID=UPI0013A6B94A|nr:MULTISPECIES: phospholipase A2 [unclassified Streptomyces]QZZ28285.1 phospholipase [Streptomyces sp. ST1015]